MGNPRLPKGKAEVSGAEIKNPGRHRDRKVSKYTRPLGEPYATMTDDQKAAWADLQYNIPWLNSSHRILVRAACAIIARMDHGDIGVSATQALSSIMSKLGATPVDETKVNHGDGDDEDPDDHFFGSH